MSPIYSFKCSKCGKEFDKLIQLKKVKDTTCECGGIAEKIFSAVKQCIKFKGSGFYVNDYKNK